MNGYHYNIYTCQIMFSNRQQYIFQVFGQQNTTHDLKHHAKDKLCDLDTSKKVS